jgi:hypothetical protein
MAFVNEKISEEDKKRHSFLESNDYYQTPPTSWTVDRERNMFLVKRASPSPREPWLSDGILYWAFYWQGQLLDVEIHTVANGQDESETHGWTHKRINAVRDRAKNTEVDANLVYDDLKDAFIAHRGLGIYSPYKTYAVILETK